MRACHRCDPSNCREQWFTARCNWNFETKAMNTSSEDCPNCEHYRLAIFQLKRELADVRKSNRSTTWSMSTLQSAAAECLRAKLTVIQRNAIREMYVACHRAAKVRALVEILGDDYTKVCDVTDVRKETVTQAKTPKRENANPAPKLAAFVAKAESAVNQHALEQRAYDYFLRLTGFCFRAAIDAAHTINWPKSVGDILGEQECRDTVELIQCGWFPEDVTEHAFDELARRRCCNGAFELKEHWGKLVEKNGRGLLVAFYLGDQNNAKKW